MSDIQTTKIKGIARHMRQMKEEGRSTALLVGAGISATAGIPMARQIINDIKTDPRYNYRLEDLEIPADNEYNALMKALTYKQREELMRGYIDKGKINLAHLYIGMLVKEGYVSSVLTTNFDPLLVKTMNLFNKHVYVYDLANIRDYVSDSILQPNLFYLHGQGHAFLMLNTPDELQRTGQYFGTLINDMMQNHFFLVAGYSGLSDFLFDKLCRFPRYSSDLVWVGYKSDTPPPHVRDGLCSMDSVKYVNSNGADAFFRELGNELGLNPAIILERPFEHLKEMLGNIGSLQYDNGSGMQNFDLLKQPLAKIDMAIELVEKGAVGNVGNELKKIDSGKMESELLSLNLQGRYDDVIARAAEVRLYNDADINQQVARAYMYKAEKEFDAGHIEAGDTLYAQAMALLPNNQAGYYNWGTDFMHAAEKTGDNETLYRRAFEKYDRAVKIQPDMYHALANWGLGLLRLYSKTRHKPYLAESIEKMNAANASAPHLCDYSLACAMALLGDKEKALELLESSFKYKTAEPHVATDEDLQLLWGDERFKKLLDTYAGAKEQSNSTGAAAKAQPNAVSK